MNPVHSALFVILASLVQANEALDILEADKTPVEPPVTQGNAAPREKPIYQELSWPGWQTRAFDPVWSRAVLFDEGANRWVQHVAITGFFDWQMASGGADVEGVGAVPSDSVDLDSSRTRRARLGARIRAFRNTDIEARAEFAGNAEYRGIERLSARTEFLRDTGVTYGKFRPHFTAEYRQEEEDSAYPDRSMLVNMIAPASTLGIRFDHRRNDWEYGIGWFSSDSDPDIPSIRGDGFLSLGVAREFVEPSGDSLMRTRWHLDYIHNFDAGRSESIPRYRVAGGSSANGGQVLADNPAFRHLFSTGFTLEQDRFSFLGDFMIAKGDTTAWGMTLAPSWWLMPGVVKLVARYHYAGSDDSGALVTTMGASSDPWFDNSPFFIGDEYHSFYLGANTHVYQDKLVIMSGVENVIFNDEAGAGFNTDAWIWHAGMKASF